ncbi:Transposase IS4 [Popillia japonica]|uniref:Transposase IS4 n=1 Tax=Popillia japonica TaxID=7064 RepID=A0AAW1L4U3_POPJA
MAFRSDYEQKRALSYKDLEEIIDNMSDIDDTDVVIIPPNVDELTDEEDIDDTEMCAPDSIPNDITGTFEVMNIGNGAACTELASEPTTSRAHSSKHQAVKWQKAYVPAKNQPNNLEEKAVRELQEQFGNHSPFELFSLFFDNTVLNAIVNYSKKYACCKNRHNFHMDMNDLRKWLGIVILSGYHCLPQMELYWSLDEDKGVPLVRKTMSRNRFRDIKQNIHLSDNTNLQKEDKFAKVRPLFDLLNERFLQFGIFSHNLSIDEQMVPYFGRHSAKMFIRGKPVRFGFKIWCLTLDEKGFYATGTIRENRTAKCLLETTKQIAKRDRGWFDAAYDKNSSIRMVRWNDNAVVTVASNIEEVEPIGNIKRYSRKEKREVQVKQPNIIEKYNSHMGGVDLHDNAIANYRIRIRDTNIEPRRRINNREEKY